MATLTPVRKAHRGATWVLLGVVLLVLLVGAAVVFWQTASPATQGTFRILIDTLLGRGSGHPQ